MAVKSVTGARQSIGNYLFSSSLAAIILVGGIGGWSATTDLSGAVIAGGQLVTESDVKKVQYQAGGTVVALNVEEGDTVKAGQELVRFDDVSLRANLAVIVSNLRQLQVREARLKAERDDLNSIELDPEILALAETDQGVSSAIFAEQRAFFLRSESREGQKSQLRERIKESNDEITGITSQLDAKKRQIDLINDDLATLSNLHDANLVTRQRLSDLNLQLAQAEGDQGQLISQLAQAKGRIAETELQILDVDRSMRSDVSKDLSDLQQQVAELREREVGAADAVAKSIIKAPQDGEVHELTIHTIGGVVGPGETMMEIVPVADQLRVEARIAPQDIDQVNAGQPVLLRFSAFNTRSTPELNGTVIGVSPDLITDPRTGAAHYDARIKINAGELDRLKGLHLTAGMPVESYVQTGERTAFSYFTKPISDYFMRSFRTE
jgi:HlyD family secretion protein